MLFWKSLKNDCNFHLYTFDMCYKLFSYLTSLSRLGRVNPSPQLSAIPIWQKQWQIYLLLGISSRNGCKNLNFLQAFINYNFSCTQNRSRCTSLHVGNRACKRADVHVTDNNMIRGRNWTKLKLKPLAGNSPTASLFQSCVLFLCCRLSYFSLHDDYPPFLQLVHYTICLHSRATIFDKLKWEVV